MIFFFLINWWILIVILLSDTLSYSFNVFAKKWIKFCYENSREFSSKWNQYTAMRFPSQSQHMVIFQHTMSLRVQGWVASMWPSWPLQSPLHMDSKGLGGSKRAGAHIIIRDKLHSSSKTAWPSKSGRTTCATRCMKLEWLLSVPES